MASDAAQNARAMLKAWRESGADRLDPVRFHVMEALARRADRHTGAARGVLDDRLCELVDAHRETVAGVAGAACKADPTASSGETAPGALAALVAYIGARAPAAGAGPQADLIDYFRDTWIKVRANRELRHSVERVPENAGPLNSSHLVQRALSLMGEMSPEYLRHFLSYVDALSSLEQLTGARSLPAKEAPPAAGPRKSTRGKPRKGGARSPA
jgi:hypothetical protein